MLEPQIVDYVVSSGSEAVALLFALYIMYKKLHKVQMENQQQLAEKVESVATRANGFFDVFLDSFDFPAWVKRVVVTDSGEIEFRTHFVNRAFEDTFEKTRVQCIGKTDLQIWSRPIGPMLVKKDLAVLKSRQTLVDIDTLENNLSLKSKRFYIYYQGHHWVVGFAQEIEEPVNG